MPPVNRGRADYVSHQGRPMLSFHMVTPGRARTGWAYDTSIPVLTASIAVSQITALGRADAIKLRRRTALLRPSGSLLTQPWSTLIAVRSA